MTKKLDNIAILFLVISGIVWGFVGLYQFNLVTYIFDREWIIRILYVIFGLSVVYHLFNYKAGKKRKSTKR